MTRKDKIPVVTPWSEMETPNEGNILPKFVQAGLKPTLWFNGPYDSYPAHSHPYHKVLYVVFGSITFGVEDRQISLKAGDRLDLPAGIVHDAHVGDAGVVCLEAQK